ncbi:unnamed protein product [Brachionus calyciflorus]|uniref:DRBM domain-containing protein n=1 Tax=Brachionus calyciflorus TaxID=104777 RepID=A0A813TDB0_9BILA|nr:unnamed protein product [Brachionus calyciflorus]
MNRNKQYQQQPPQQQFRFNKVNTIPQNQNINTNSNTNTNNQNDQNHKRKIETPNQPNFNNNFSNEHSPIKKLKQEAPNENAPNGVQSQNDQSKKHLQILNDLTTFHKRKAKYDVISETGPQHAKIFQIKCTIYDPLTQAEIETYTASGSSINRAKQAAAELAITQTKLEKPTPEQLKKKRAVKNQPKQKENQQVKPSVTKIPKTAIKINKNKAENVIPIKQKGQDDEFIRYEVNNQIFNKKHLLAKHTQIQPSKKYLELISFILKRIELKLKSISEQLLNEKLSTLENTEEKEKDKEKYRELKGVFRTGYFGKGIFLKTDQFIDLIVTFDRYPDYFLIQKIIDQLKTSDLFETKLEIDQKSQTSELFKHENLNLNFTNESIKNDACVTLTYNDQTDTQINYQFRMYFTCLEINKETNVDTLIKIEEDNFYLPLDKCLQLNQILNHQKWFDLNLKPISNSLLILRILREFCMSNSDWSALDENFLEILVHKSFHMKKFENIALKLRTFFEVLSSGILLLPNLQITNKYLTDSEGDIFSLKDIDGNEFEMSLEKRELLTYKAQEALRMIVFNKIHILLGIDLIVEKCDDAQLDDEDDKLEILDLNKTGLLDQNSSDSDGFRPITTMNDKSHFTPNFKPTYPNNQENEKNRFVPAQNFQKPQSLMSLSIDQKKIPYNQIQNNTNNNNRPFNNNQQQNRNHNKPNGKFDRNKDKNNFQGKKFGDKNFKKEIKPNSAAAAALAIANQSNKNPTPFQTISTQKPIQNSNGAPQPVAPPVAFPNPPPALPQSNNPIPVPPPKFGKPPVPPPTATASNVSQAVAGAPSTAYPAFPGYPGYDPYAYQAYYAQWQAQYYQQWQWAAYNQAYSTQAQTIPKPPQPPEPTSVPFPPPPPPPIPPPPPSNS